MDIVLRIPKNRISDEKKNYKISFKHSSFFRNSTENIFGTCLFRGNFWFLGFFFHLKICFFFILQGFFKECINVLQSCSADNNKSVDIYIDASNPIAQHISESDQKFPKFMFILGDLKTHPKFSLGDILDFFLNIENLDKNITKIFFLKHSWTCNRRVRWFSG